MKLLVGLGNPGAAYSLNRHNVGFMAIDAIANSYNFSPFKAKHQGLITEGTINNHKLLLLKPETFMNRSGQSVAAVAQFYKISPENIFVFHDELALVVGKIKVKTGGGHNGHNGLKSLDSHISKEYTRIRIGIHHPGDKDAVADYVLSNFSKTDKTLIDEIIISMAKNVTLLIKGEPDHFMSKVAMAS